MKYTENLGLKKPELIDKVKVEDFNDNSEIIDRTVSLVKNQVEEQSKLYDGFEQDNKAFNGQIINWNRGLLLNVSGADVTNQDNNIIVIKPFADTQYINIETHLLDSDSHILGLKNYNGEGILSTAGINPETKKLVELSMTPFTNASKGIVRQVDRYKHRPFPVSRLTLAINLPIGKEYSLALDDVLLANGDKHKKEDIAWNELQVKSFPEHFTNMASLSKGIQEQSKSNLVLVTAMQKLLSEKIEELEREYSWTKNLPTNLIKFRKTIYKKRGEETIAIPVNIPMDGEYAVFCKASVYGDKKPDRLRIGYNGGSEVFGENGSMVKQVSTHIAGIKNIPFFAGANAGESIENVGKFENLMMVKNDDLLIDVPFYRNIELIQEELDFYKSQLEKLKLTQEVDLNLLLTL